MGKPAGKILKIFVMYRVGTCMVHCPFPCDVLAMYQPGTLVIAPSVRGEVGAIVDGSDGVRFLVVSHSQFVIAARGRTLFKGKRGHRQKDGINEVGMVPAQRGAVRRQRDYFRVK